MRRRTGGSLLRTATSELTPLTAARLSALQQPRLPDVDETSALTATALNASTHASTGRALTALADHALA